MNINNNFTPLAWHKGDIELQSHRATYAYGHVVPLMAGSGTLVSFQIITEPNEVDASSAVMRLRKPDGTVAVNVNLWSLLGMTIKTVRLRAADVEAGVSAVDVDVVIYNGREITPKLPIGQYYLTLESGNTTWYSDMVTIVDNVRTLTRVTWWDTKDLVFGAGAIKYSYTVNNADVQYKNYMYFLEEIGMPEYTVEEEGEQRDGLFYASKIVSGKKYKMNVAQCTEAMCDAMRFIHLSDNVEVRDGYGRVYHCDSVLVTPEWIDGGTVAKATVEITTDTFVKQLGGGYEGTEPVSGNTGVIGEGVIGETLVIGED